ncbi:Endonuclease-reverse transcriptase [Operophtera brumata]|uniref:Endonuclease-reverse transcriptase n=1 Tax=Operophtera brumata TaxID=104452 RepID=A0A0L7KWR4_OPEBR|nr:Endonuclease-reverse transcriptase [Operophtera brumata]
MKRGEELIFGKYSHGERSAQGQKMVELALAEKFKIVNSMFKRKRNRKWTWRHPNGKNFNEIDYILTKYTRDLPLITGKSAKYWESKFTESLSTTVNIQQQYNKLEDVLKLLLNELPRSKEKEKVFINQETNDLLEKRRLLYKRKRTK